MTTTSEARERAADAGTGPDLAAFGLARDGLDYEERKHLDAGRWAHLDRSLARRERIHAGLSALNTAIFAAMAAVRLDDGGWPLAFFGGVAAMNAMNLVVHRRRARRRRDEFARFADAPSA